jgi:hypothetical protein
MRAVRRHAQVRKGKDDDFMKKPVLVVTSSFIEQVDARIEKEYKVRRKADGTLFTRDAHVDAGIAARIDMGTQPWT